MKYALFVGEMLIDFIPAASGPGGTPYYQPHPGGAVANAAVALARLGGSARFVGKLAQDGFGRLLLRTLQEDQVDARYVSTTERGNTTLALVALQENGERAFHFYRQQTADTLLEAGDLHERVWEDAVFCHTGSVLLASEPARSATLAALEQARQRALITSFDVNARPALWQSQREMRELLVGILTRVDLLKCSAEEAHFLDPALSEPLAASDTPRLHELAQRLLAFGPSLIIITRGRLGALLCTRQQTCEAPVPPQRVIDTTGAGDAFMGATLRWLIERNQVSTSQLAALSSSDLHALGAYANAAAAISCTRSGGIASLPYAHEVEQI